MSDDTSKGPVWPLGGLSDFGLKSYQWCGNSQPCALFVPGDLWGTGWGVLLRESQEHSGVCSACFPRSVWSSDKAKALPGQKSNKEQEKMAFSHIEWCGRRWKASLRAPGVVGEGCLEARLAVGLEREERRNIVGRFPSVTQSGHHTYSSLHST